MGGHHHKPSAAGKGHHKGYGGGGDTVHLDLRPEVAKELHQVLTAALGGVGKHHPKPGGKAVSAKGGKGG